MPNVSPGITLERHNDARDRMRVCPHGVFPALLVGIRGNPRTKESEFFLRIKRWNVGLTVKNVKANQVQVDGMRVVGRIYEPADFGARNPSSATRRTKDDTGLVSALVAVAVGVGVIATAPDSARLEQVGKIVGVDGVAENNRLRRVKDFLHGEYIG